MAQSPPPGGGGSTQPWWVVWYEPLGSRAPGTASSLYLIIQAAKKSDITADSVGGAAITSVDGPFETQADAQADAGKGPVPGRGKKTNVQASGGADVKFPNITFGLRDIGKFFSELGQANTWIRAGEVVLGLILIAVGVARITHAVPVATKIAKAVGTKGLA